MARKISAAFSQSRNDMHWSVHTMEDGFIRWAGYNDDYWWNNVATKDGFRQRTGEETGNTYTLDPRTNEVTVIEQVSA